MAGAIRTLLQRAQARRVAWRRARNMHGAAAAPIRMHTPGRMLDGIRSIPRSAIVIGAAGLLAAGTGGVIIARHAQQLTRAVQASAAPSQAGAPFGVLPQFEAALPGATIHLPAGGAMRIEQIGATTVLVAPDPRPGPPLRIDLCTQLGSGGKLLPIRLGYGFEEVAALAARTGAQALRTVGLRGQDAADMPRMQLSGDASVAGTPLRLRWEAGPPATRWIGDLGNAAGSTGEAAFGKEGWLAWRPDAALRLVRQASAGCKAGHLLVQVVRTGSATAPPSSGRAMLAAFPGSSAPVTATLAAGDYRVPAGPAPGLEDQALFEQLKARGLVRLDGDGLAQLAPRDLAAWRAAPTAERAGELAQWNGVLLDDGALRLLKRAYRMADGAYVRDQLRIFNGEQRLLAWRLPAQGAPAQSWQASLGDTPAATTAAMPPSAARLFSAVGEGWQPWRRIDGWPAASGTQARLTLPLAQPARAGDTISLMLIGRGDAAELLVLAPQPGARAISLAAAALDMAVLAMPGDQRYRHLRAAKGQLDWLPVSLPSQVKPMRTALAPAAIRLEDRNGALLWLDGAPTPAAATAGLAPLLGIRAEHTASVAGMLARLPAGVDGSHTARLTIDLGLQAASQRALECIGMRHGQRAESSLDAACSGGQAPPAGRHAGMVIVDAETGDILAAAGAGQSAVTAANWLEVRNFDRSDPARSPLRLPALQHDGGAYASPGSTFKVISALGLEQAARSDPQLDALLGGLPLGDINRIARQRGFAFETAAAVYPAATRQVHITNYKDQDLDRRAVAGRLGLAQAMTYSLNTWFAWTGELSDRSLLGRAEGGAPDLQPLEADALDQVRPIAGMARTLGFGQALRLDGGLLPPDFRWGAWDALQASASHIDPVHSRHELRQMAIGLRMQVTPLQMALAAAAVGQGATVAPRLLLALDGRSASAGSSVPLGVRLDRVRAGMKGVVDVGTAAGAFRGPALAGVRRGLSGKTGTAPTGSGDEATVWFTGFLEAGSLPGQTHRLALAAFVSHSSGSGGEHAAPIVAAVLAEVARGGLLQPRPGLPTGRPVLAKVDLASAEQTGK